jgi:hypothetical protein
MRQAARRLLLLLLLLLCVYVTAVGTPLVGWPRQEGARRWAGKQPPVHAPAGLGSEGFGTLHLAVCCRAC